MRELYTRSSNSFDFTGEAYLSNVQALLTSNLSMPALGAVQCQRPCLPDERTLVRLPETQDMSSTITRPAAPLIITPTQNTAPVLDFQCLYTYDLRRKAKRWQDGLARFHTFNKRIMVYDEPRNFIGDTHWREADPVQNGDELQLDKGVLIQIGEATGRMDQDISGLFEKKKVKGTSAEGSSPVRARVTEALSEPTARGCNTSSSQVRPKTLNALLGTPKGRIGRATLPDRSPFEVQRSSRAENDIEVRPTKRQRVMISDEKRSNLAKALIEPKTIDIVHPAPEISEPAEHQSQQPRASKAVISSANQDKRLEKSPQESMTQEKAKLREVVSEPRRPQNGAREAKVSRPTDCGGPVDQRGVTSEFVIVDSVEKSQARRELVPQGVRLKIASSKPRKKLMFKESLEPVEPVVKETTDSVIGMTDRHPSKKKPPKKKGAALQREPLSHFHEEQMNRVRQRLQNHDERTECRDPEIDQVANETKPLFVSDDELPIPFPDHSDSERGHPQVVLQPCSHTLSRQRASMSPSFSPFPTYHAALKLAEMDSLLLQYPKEPAPKPPSANVVNPPLPTPDTNVLLANSPFKSPPAPLSKIAAKPFRRSLSATTATNTKPMADKRSLRKSVSDTSAIGAGSRRGSGSISRDVGVEALPDPWSREAWDLFGYGREGFSEVEDGLA